MRVTVRRYNPLMEINLESIMCPPCAMQDCRGVARSRDTRGVALLK